MNRIFKLIFTCALCFTALFGVCHAQEKYIRVGIHYSSTAFAGSVDISSPTGFIVGEYSSGEFTETLLSDASSLKITLGDNGSIEFDNSSFIHTSSQEADQVTDSREQALINLGAMQESSSQDTAQESDGKTLYIMSKPSQTQGEVSYITVNGKKYPEILEFSADANGKIRVINIVELEQYVKGVLPNEIYPSWEPEALKVAAIAARTVALKAGNGKHSAHNFDVCSTTDCQVYGGVTKIADSTNLAADQTKGLVLMYNGKLAEALYHAISGGITESANGAWGSPLESFPYLTIQKTPHENYKDLPNGTWHHAYTQSELYSLVNTRHPDKLSDISDISCETDGGSYIHRMTISDSGGNKVELKTSSAVRNLFNKYAKSANFTLKRTFMPSDSSSDNTQSSTITVITADGVQKVSTEDGLTYKTADSQQKLFSITPIWFMDGKGYGHGVGLSQYGSQHAALQGYTHEQILALYFPGTTINSIYENTQDNQNNGVDSNEN